MTIANSPGVNGVNPVISPTAEVIKQRKKPRVEKKSKLSLNQVRKNHVVSEQRRRELVRGIYDDLVGIVPGLEKSERRSEFLIYVKTMNHLSWLYKRNSYLRAKLYEKYESQGRSNVAIPNWLVWDLPQSLAHDNQKPSPSPSSK